MYKNLIAKNYKKFTFDLVVTTNFKVWFKHKAWSFLVNEDGKKEHTVNIHLGFFHITVWKKSPRMY